MIKHDVYISYEDGQDKSQDVLGEILANKKNIAYNYKNRERDAYAQYLALRALPIIEAEIEIHRKMYPWYSGYAWVEQEPWSASTLPGKIVHKSYCIAARYE